MLRIGRPDDFVQRGDHLPGAFGDLILVRAGALFDCRNGGQHADFSEAGTEFIVQITGDAGALLVHRPVPFDIFALSDLRFEFARALFHLAVQLGDPQYRPRQHANQRAGHHQQPFQRPPRRPGQDFDVRRRVEQQLKGSHLLTQGDIPISNSVHAGQFQAATDRQ